jgi:ribosome-binding protein aMBF1 (putative translation factor)
VTVDLRLSLDEARLLVRNLERRVQNVARELAGTSKRELQHELATEEATLRAIATRLAALLGDPGR